MKAIICDNSYKERWNQFVKDNSNDFGLLQLWEWGVFSETIGKKVFRTAVEKDGAILAVALVIEQKLKLGKKYFYIPRGPILIDDKSASDKQVEILELLFNEIKTKAKKEGAIFLRMDPAWQDGDTLRQILSESGFIPSGQVQPKETLVLNLRKSEEELLGEMKPKTRYNIKIAKKHHIEIDSGERYFEDFWKLMEKTTTRQEITPHPKNYYLKLLQVLGEAGLAELVVAKYEGKVIVANLMINTGRWCAYLHGASDYEHRNKMAPYLLQWTSIKKAKDRSCRQYDFWGVDEKKWPGVTRFKYGFSKETKVTGYIGSWDEVYSSLWYNLYKLLRR